MVFNGVNIYPLKEGKTYISSKHNTLTRNQAQVDYLIHESEKTECYLNRLENNKVYLYIINGEFQLNEKLLVKENNCEQNVLNGDLSGGVELKNGDILLIGEFNMFKFFNPFEMNDVFVSSLAKKNSLKVLVKNYFTNIKKYEFLDGQTNAQNEKILACELLMEEQCKKIDQMKEQLEINAMEINQLRELNDKKEEDAEISMRHLVEKFEQDEKLLNECFQNLKKPQESQLKSFIFELQNLKFREQELDMDLKRRKCEIEKVNF